MRTARDWDVYFGEVVLLVALELSATSWRLCFGANGRRRQVTITPGDAERWDEAGPARSGAPAKHENSKIGNAPACVWW